MERPASNLPRLEILTEISSPGLGASVSKHQRDPPENPETSERPLAFGLEIVGVFLTVPLGLQVLAGIAGWILVAVVLLAVLMCVQLPLLLVLRAATARADAESMATHPSFTEGTNEDG